MAGKAGKNGPLKRLRVLPLSLFDATSSTPLRIAIQEKKSIMSMDRQSASRVADPGAALSLYHLLDPEVLADPYPLFHRLRREDPVHWDPFLHAWIVTRYADVLEVLHHFSADRTPSPEQLRDMGLAQLGPVAQVMVKQMLFMDAPAHTRLRSLASKAFTPAHIETLKTHIAEIVNNLLDAVEQNRGMDVITELAEPLPAIVTAEMLGVPVPDHRKLKVWSANFAEMLGNFQHNPEHAPAMLKTVEDMTAYFRDTIQDLKRNPREGLIHALLTAEIDGDRLSEEEVIANTIVTMVGGQETTTNLIGNGLLTLLRNPDQMEKLRGDLSLIPSAVEEMLRFESPSQHTARLAPSDRQLGGKLIRQRQAVIAIMAAANRDPDRFPDPDRFDITRQDNRHLAFGYAAHFCFGAPLARVEGQIAFEALLRRFSEIELEPQKLVWRTNLGLRGLTSLRVRLASAGAVHHTSAEEQHAQEHQSSNVGESAPPSGAVSDLHQSSNVPYPRKCVHELVAEQADRTPNAAAVIQGHQQLTFKELNELANQLADHLKKWNLATDTPVAICLPRSLELTVALLGVMKAGAACMPLDPDYPAERLAYMLEDSQAPVLITHSGLLTRFGSATPEVIEFKSDWEILRGGSKQNPPVADPESLAYIIYTSGSTGKPRGVLLSHRGLVNHHCAAIKLYDLRPTDRTLQFSSISFDIAVEEIFPTWIAGGAVILRTPDMPLAAGDFLHWSERNKITVWDLPTAYWHELARELAESGTALPKSLRLVIVGGEKASASAYASWLKCGGNRVRWINTYGPTEASIIVSSYEPKLGEPIPDNLPIGRPIANTRLYILDERLKPVPVGAPGELHIGGPGVARGYLRRPELTADKFIPDPFSKNAADRLYKTGDLVRWLADGNIEFLGRTDFQVKIRGFRVEPGEIENVLERHPGVAGAVVVAREIDGEKRLAAYIVRSTEKPNETELRSFVKKQLPEYMVPADFVFLGSFPLTPNGKVDRRGLPAPQARVVEADESFVAPRDEAEKRMARVWEQVLRKRPIGIHDNFFDLGGHSLLAVRLTQAVEKEFGTRLLLTVLLEAPTVEQLAALVQGKTSGTRSSIIALQPEGTKPAFYFVHGMGGSVLRFRDLARNIPRDQPFYGIQARGLDGAETVLNRVEDMVRVYLSDLRAFQPEGPYRLGGYSFGGYVALEMARQLLADGQEIGALILVDTYVHGQQSLWQRFSSLPLERQVAYVTNKLGRYKKGIKRRIGFLFLPPAVKQVRRSCIAAEESYQPQLYPGRITLFRASERGLRGLEDSGGGWEKFAGGGLEVHEFDGDHGNILNEPSVRTLATRLCACLEAAQTSPAAVPAQVSCTSTAVPNYSS
jgi:amino acid adenylation domain-containing protein